LSSLCFVFFVIALHGFPFAHMVQSRGVFLFVFSSLRCSFTCSFSSRFGELTGPLRVVCRSPLIRLRFVSPCGARGVFSAAISTISLLCFSHLLQRSGLNCLIRAVSLRIDYIYSSHTPRTFSKPTVCSAGSAPSVVQHLEPKVCDSVSSFILRIHPFFLFTKIYFHEVPPLIGKEFPASFYVPPPLCQLVLRRSLPACTLAVFSGTLTCLFFPFFYYSIPGLPCGIFGPFGEGLDRFDVKGKKSQPDFAPPRQVRAFPFPLWPRSVHRGPPLFSGGAKVVSSGVCSFFFFEV